MEPVQETTTVIPVSSTTSSPGLFGTKIPASAAFLIAILLFLLPFAEVKCNGTALANNTGIGLAMGSEWKETGSKSLFGNDFGTNNSGAGNTTTSNENKFKKQDANMFAIVALGLGLLGVLIAFLAANGGGKVNLVIGVLAAISLVAMLIDLKSKLKSDNSIKSSEFDLNVGMKMTVDATPAYYFAVILFIAAAIFSYLRVKDKQPT